MGNDKLAKITDFKDAKKIAYEKECSEAYAWISEVQETQGWYCDDLKLTFEYEDKIIESDCITALFFDKESGKAILYREWPEDMLIKFNYIINPIEMKYKAPQSFKKIIECGLDLYRQRGTFFKCRLGANK